MTKAGTMSRKEPEWRGRLARFAASGLQVKQFCSAETVSEAVFFRWRQRLQGTSADSKPTCERGFIALASAEAASGATLDVKLDLGHGMALHILRR